MSEFRFGLSVIPIYGDAFSGEGAPGKSPIRGVVRRRKIRVLCNRKLGKEDLSGRRVALFGCGDAGIYSDTFCDAMAEIRDGLASTGCTFVGGFDAEEYPGCGSRLCQDGEAIGWAVDDSASDAENQMRMELWIAAIG